MTFVASKKRHKVYQNYSSIKTLNNYAGPQVNQQHKAVVVLVYLMLPLLVHSTLQTTALNKNT